MPTNLTDNLSWAAHVVAPASGDARTAASVATGLQAAADRTAYLKQAVDVDGVRWVRNAGSTATLKALTGVAVGELRLAGQALYMFVGLDASLEDAPWVLKPSDVTQAAAGRWHLVALGYADSADFSNGYATVRKLRAERVHNGVFAVAKSQATYNHFSAINSASEDAALRIQVNDLEPGDVLVWSATGNARWGGSGSNAGIVEMRLLLPDATLATTGAYRAYVLGGSASAQNVTLQQTYTTAQYGSHQLKIYAESGAATDTVTLDNWESRVMVLRP